MSGPTEEEEGRRKKNAKRFKHRACVLRGPSIIHARFRIERVYGSMCECGATSNVSNNTEKKKCFSHIIQCEAHSYEICKATLLLRSVQTQHGVLIALCRCPIFDHRSIVHYLPKLESSRSGLLNF